MWIYSRRGTLSNHLPSRYHIFRLPVSTRQLPFASILLAYTRHGLSLSRGYCLSSNGRRMRACTGACIHRNRVRDRIYVCVCVDRRIFHREGIRPRVAQYFSSNASRAFLLLNPAPCLTRRNEILRRDNADEFVIYNRSTYVHFIAPRFASFRFYGREFLRPLIDSPAETRVHAHASNRAV